MKAFHQGVLDQTHGGEAMGARIGPQRGMCPRDESTIITTHGPRKIVRKVA